MSRTQLLDADQAPITAQQYFADGDPGPIVAALATVPELLGPTLNFVGAAFTGIGVTGGEPLLFPWLPETVAAIVEHLPVVAWIPICCSLERSCHSRITSTSLQPRTERHRADRSCGLPPPR
ncbi:MAG: hypothetical protein ABIR12_07275 [Ilumatobacteraceae bacterium]